MTGNEPEHRLLTAAEARLFLTSQWTGRTAALRLLDARTDGQQYMDTLDFGRVIIRPAPPEAGSTDASFTLTMPPRRLVTIPARDLVPGDVVTFWCGFLALELRVWEPGMPDIRNPQQVRPGWGRVILTDTGHPDDVISAYFAWDLDTVPVLRPVQDEPAE